MRINSCFHRLVYNFNCLFLGSPLIFLTFANQHQDFGFKYLYQTKYLLYLYFIGMHFLFFIYSMKFNFHWDQFTYSFENNNINFVIITIEKKV